MDPNLIIRLLVITYCSFVYINDLFLTEVEPLMIWCERELASLFEMEDDVLLD